MRKRRDIHGGNQGRHRRDEHKFYRNVYYPLTLDMFRPFQILGVLSKSFISSSIKIASMVDGKAAFLSHVGQILEWSPLMEVPRPQSGLVVSEAVWPKHQYTPVEDYLQEQAEGKCRLTLMDIDPIVWAGDLEAKKFAESECYDYHIGLKGTKYGLNIFPALLAFSIYRNFTPFCRGRFENIIIKKFTKIFICSNEVDSGW